MHTSSVLLDLLFIYGLAGLVVYLFHRFRIPSIVGLLCAGILAGPDGLGLIENEEKISLLAEIGVVILLFAVGLEFSLSRMLRLWASMLAIGLPQVIISVLGGTLISYFHTGSFQEALTIGLLISLSSTAVVIKLISDRGELGTPYGKLSVAILLLQDLLVALFIVILPLLASQNEHTGGAASIWNALEGIAVVAGILLGSRYLLSPLFSHLVRLRNRELFFIFMFLLCLGTAFLTEAFGLSLALGAFLAGLALSESEYSHQLFSEVSPFRDTLSSLFFISVGMLLDLNFVFESRGLVLQSVVLVCSLKFFAIYLPTRLAGFPNRIGLSLGAALFQVGEFSFLLAERASALNLLSPPNFQLFLSTAVISILLTPFAVSFASYFTSSKLLPGSELKQDDSLEANPPLNNHVVIVGYGLNGRNLSRVLRISDIPYVVLELNPQAVARYGGDGEPIVFGDSTRPSALLQVGLKEARVLVVAISDAAASLRTVKLARTLNPQLHIVVRTEYVTHIDELKKVGADEVIPQDFVTSVEIFSRVLRDYNIPRNQILDFIEQVRDDHYGALRALRPAKLNFLHQELADNADLETCLIKQTSPAIGKTLIELDLRGISGATLLGVKRAGILLSNPSPSFALECNDIAFLFGARAEVHAAQAILDPELSR